jgi:hypothetical protein
MLKSGRLSQIGGGDMAKIEMVIDCPFLHNADLKASKNIRDKYLAGWSTSPFDAPRSNSLKEVVYG